AIQIETEEVSDLTAYICPRDTVDVTVRILGMFGDRIEGRIQPYVQPSTALAVRCVESKIDCDPTFGREAYLRGIADEFESILAGLGVRYYVYTVTRRRDRNPTETDSCAWVRKGSRNFYRISKDVTDGFGIEIGIELRTRIRHK